MTQILRPLHGRAFTALAVARSVAPHGPQTLEHAMREFRCVAAEFGVFVREADGKQFPVTLKWVLGMLEPWVHHMPFWVVRRQIKGMVRYRKRGAPIVFTRAQCDFFSQPRAKLPPKIKKTPAPVIVAAPVVAEPEAPKVPQIDWDSDRW